MCTVECTVECTVVPVLSCSRKTMQTCYHGLIPTHMVTITHPTITDTDHWPPVNDQSQHWTWKSGLSWWELVMTVCWSCLLGRCHMTRVDTVQTCVQRSAGADWSSSDLQQFREKLSSRHSDQVVTIILSSVTNQHWDKRGDSVLTWPGNECQTKVQKYFINKWRKIFCYLRVWAAAA